MPPSKKVDLNTLISEQDWTFNIQASTPEDPDEKALRLKKELAVYVLGILCVIVIGGYSLVILTSPATTHPDTVKQWATTSLTTIMAGFAGALFGKRAL